MSTGITLVFKNNHVENLNLHNCNRDTKMLVHTYLKLHLNALTLSRASSRVRWLNAELTNVSKTISVLVIRQTKYLECWFTRR